MPKVSVILPTYNRAGFLKEAIESILCQDFRDFELIISDNCSTDNTENVVKPYLEDLRVKYFKNNQNVGPINNHNLALRRCQGSYICTFSDDDVMLQGHLKGKVKVLDENPNVVLVHSSMNIIDKEGKVVSSGHWGKTTMHQHHVKEEIQSGKNAFDILYQHWNYISMPTVLLRRKALNDLRLEFNNQLKYLVDWDLWLNLSDIGDFYFMDEPNVLLRKHETNETSLMNKQIIFNELLLMKLSFQSRKNVNLSIKQILETHKTTKKQIEISYPSQNSFLANLKNRIVNNLGL